MQVTRHFSGSRGMGLPADAWIEDDEDLNEDAVKSVPRFQPILDAMLAHPGLHVLPRIMELADEFGFDPTDPDIIARAVESAKRSAARHLQYLDRRAELRRSHDPVVYYMRTGNRIKIGTTVNIVGRIEAVAPEELVTMEHGGYALERKRHKEFDVLRTSREWFKYEDALADHVKWVAARFEADFGAPILQWMNGHYAVRGVS